MCFSIKKNVREIIKLPEKKKQGLLNYGIGV